MIGPLMPVLTVGALAAFRRRVDVSYLLFGMLIVVFHLSFTGTGAGVLRYYTAIFPIYIVLAKISASRRADDILTSGLMLVQGFMMALWVSGVKVVI
jgi:hypothetical protein